jgi:hypothetical protein
LQRLGEVAADRHRLADDFIVVVRWVRLGELLESETWNLDDDVVQCGLERCGGFLGDVVGDLIEGVSDGEFRGDLRDREAGGLRGQCGGSRDRGFISITISRPSPG